MTQSTPGPIYTFPLDGREVVLGRDPSSTIVLQGFGVSRRHAVVRCGVEGAVVEDCGSPSGVLVNGRSVRHSSLGSGDLLGIGIADFEVRLEGASITLTPTQRREPAEVGDEVVERSHILHIGRDSSNDIVVEHPLVSRFHAEMHRVEPNGFQLVDLNSTNGTYVNGVTVRQALLKDGDVVQVGPSRLSLVDGHLFQVDDAHRIRVEALDISVESRGKLLLGSVSLTLQPGEFAALLGPSGAGKTTLANALAGRVGLSSGRILYNGLPLKRFISAFSSRIGFVTQENLLFPELTVDEMFREQSLLRLPRDSTAVERVCRIQEVLGMLDLERVRRSRIGHLSGGEAKRVHLGIELLSSPTVVFLDEPMAGLDTGLVRRFMELFRTLGSRGHSMVVTTHTLEDINLCDRVIFMKRGALLFDGKPSEVTSSLGVGSLAEVYEQARLAGPGTNRRGREARGVEKGTIPDLLHQSALRVDRLRSVSFIRQLRVLVPRYTKILTRDWRSLTLICAQVPLIAGLLRCVYDGDTEFLPVSFYFCVAVSAIWCGGANSIREIAREWAHFDREYRVGLSIGAYLMAKVVVLGGFSLIQALLFALVLNLLFPHFAMELPVVAALSLGSVAGSLLGLALSSVSGSVRQAVGWLPIVFIPQIFLSGVLLPFDRMPVAGDLLSRLTIARPVFSLFKQQVFLDVAIWKSNEWLWLLSLCAGLFILMLAGLRLRRFFQRW